MSAEERINKALAIAIEFGGADGNHHKAWVIDQMVRALLTPEEYDKLVREACEGEDGPNTYDWDVGIPP